jgi:hypothetical protein
MQMIFLNLHKDMILKNKNVKSLFYLIKVKKIKIKISFKVLMRTACSLHLTNSKEKYIELHLRYLMHQRCKMITI